MTHHIPEKARRAREYQQDLPGLPSVHNTTGTHAKWHDLQSWYEAWLPYIAAKNSSEHGHKAWQHIFDLEPFAKQMINRCTDTRLIDQVLETIRSQHFIAPRGQRQNHPITPLIMHLKNRKTSIPSAQIQKP